MVLAGVDPEVDYEWRVFNSVMKKVYRTFLQRSFDSDEDGIANPGEEILLDLAVSNLSNLNAQDVTLFIDSSNGSISITAKDVIEKKNTVLYKLKFS